MPGHESETNRQIDVSIRWSDVQDVRATRGVMVCRSGFTKNAKTYARNKGIGLYNLHDAESQNWRLELTIPLLWVDLHPRAEVHCQAYFAAGEALLLDDGQFILSTNPGKNRINPFSTFERLWNAQAIPHTPGTLHTLPPSAEPVSVLVEDTNGNKVWRPTEFAMVYEVDFQAWLGQFTPAE